MKRFQKSRFVYACILTLSGLSATQCTSGSTPKIKPVDESYKPEKPIAFPHDIHVRKGIDCNYCHHAASDDKKEGIPTANVCTNCHKEVKASSIPENGR